MKKYRLKYLQFGYSTGTMINSSVSYYLYIKNDKYYIDIKLNGVPEEKKQTKKLEEKDINNIEKILKNHEVFKWDGFNKSNPNVLDGNSFSISIGYENNEKINALGYEMYPENYQNIKESLEKIFMDIYTRKKE